MSACFLLELSCGSWRLYYFDRQLCSSNSLSIDDFIWWPTTKLQLPIQFELVVALKCCLCNKWQHSQANSPRLVDQIKLQNLVVWRYARSESQLISINLFTTVWQKQLVNESQRGQANGTSQVSCLI